MIANTFFTENLKEGRVGEDIAVKYLSSLGLAVRDVSREPSYFSKDIDLIATFEGGGQMTVEVKADAKISQTGNVCIELVGNRAKNKLGWFYYCEATHLFFVDVNSSVCHCVRREELQELYENKKHEFRHTIRPQKENGEYYKEAGLVLIPLSELRQLKHYKEGKI